MGLRLRGTLSYEAVDTTSMSGGGRNYLPGKERKSSLGLQSTGEKGFCPSLFDLYKRRGASEARTSGGEKRGNIRVQSFCRFHLVL